MKKFRSKGDTYEDLLISQVSKGLGVKKIVFHNGYASNTYYEKEWIRNSDNFWKDFMKDKDESIARERMFWMKIISG